MRLVRVLRVERALQDEGLEGVGAPAEQGRRAEEEGESPAEDDDGEKDLALRPPRVGVRAHYVNEPVEGIDLDAQRRDVYILVLFQ